MFLLTSLRNIASFSENVMPNSSFNSRKIPSKLVSPDKIEPPLHSHKLPCLFHGALLLIKISYLEFKIIPVTTI